MTLVMTDDPSRVPRSRLAVSRVAPGVQRARDDLARGARGPLRRCPPAVRLLADRRGRGRRRRAAHAAVLAGHERAASGRGAGSSIDAWLARDPELNGANGPPATARALGGRVARADGWPQLVHARDGDAHADRGDRSAACAGRTAAGRRALRARAADRMVARVRASRRDLARGDRAAANVDARLDDGGLFVWDDGGAVSLLAVSPSVARVARHRPRVHAARVPRGAGTRAWRSPRSAGARWPAAPARACCSPISPTRPRTRSTPRSATGAIAGWEEHVFTREP